MKNNLQLTAALYSLVIGIQKIKHGSPRPVEIAPSRFVITFPNGDEYSIILLECLIGMGFGTSAGVGIHGDDNGIGWSY